MPDRSQGQIVIFSSMEGAQIASRVEAELHDAGLNPVGWKEPSLIPAGRVLLDSIQQAVAEADAAILIMTPDLSIDNRGKQVRIPRPNLIFELGLSMERLGRDRTIVLGPSAPDFDLPSDIAGVKYVAYEDSDDPQAVYRSVRRKCPEIVDHLVASEAKGTKRMTWATYEQLVRELGTRFMASPAHGGFQPHLVIAVGAGGAIVGGLLYFFHDRTAFAFASVFPRNQSAELMGGVVTAILPRADARRNEGEPLKVLAVDGSLKTGTSLAAALAGIRPALAGIEHELKSAVLVDVPKLRKADVSADYVMDETYAHFPYGPV